MMEASLLVLAGGRGSRMGRPKAWLEAGDTILLRHVAGRLAPDFQEVLVAFAEPEQMEQPVPYRIVFDRIPNAGPLAGLEAGLAAARHDVVFTIACDMPYVELSTARLAVAAARTCDAAIPRHDGRAEPACGAYRKRSIAAITAALQAGRLKLTEVVESLDVTWLEDLDPAQFRSLNTPADLDRFHAGFPTRR